MDVEVNGLEPLQDALHRELDEGPGGVRQPLLGLPHLLLAPLPPAPHGRRLPKLLHLPAAGRQGGVPGEHRSAVRGELGLGERYENQTGNIP